MPPKHKQTNDSGWNPWRRSKSRPEGTFVLNLIDAGSSTDINQSIISNKQQQTYAPPRQVSKKGSSHQPKMLRRRAPWHIGNWALNLVNTRVQCIPNIINCPQQASQNEYYACTSNIPRIGSDCGEGVHRDPKETWNSTSSTQGPSSPTPQPKHQQWQKHQSFHKKQKHDTLPFDRGGCAACMLVARAGCNLWVWWLW